MGSTAVNRRALAAVTASLVAAVVLVWLLPVGSIVDSSGRRVAILLAGYTLLLATSGYVVAASLAFAGADVEEETADTGRAVGKVENVLILTLTLLGAYTALGLVFTAKSIVRWQDISSGNTTYYLTGSVANVTYSLVYGVALAATVPWS